jgi:LAS superfamily LD-carboxypeptidase LdcB
VAESSTDEHLGHDDVDAPGVPAPAGRADAGAPDATLGSTLNTPGPLGRNDWADPDHPAWVLRSNFGARLDWQNPVLPTFRLTPPFSTRLSLGTPPAAPPQGKANAVGIPASELTPCDTDEKTEFKHKVYEAACQRASHTRKYFGGVEPSNLSTVEGSYKMRSDAAEAAKKLLAAVRAELKTQQAAKTADAMKVTVIAITSGYRDPKKDFGLWDKYFEGYYKNTEADRAALAGGPHGPAAVDFLAKYIGKYKAAPGYSNHTQGIAFDITTTEGGKVYTADKKQNAAWEKTWLRKWLLANAGTYGFRKLETEAWHWDWKP